MKRKNLLTKLFSIAFVLGTFSFSVAQDLDLTGTMLKATDDAGKIMENYLISPLGNTLGASLNNGWYNTAKTHKLLRFDINVSVNMPFIPSAQTKYTFKNSDYKQLGILGTNGLPDPNAPGVDAPNIFGEAKEGPEVGIKIHNPLYDVMIPGTSIRASNNQDTVLTKFKLPQGSNVGFGIPLPTANLRIGLIKSTDLFIRFIPTIKTGDFKVGLWGIGFMHSIKQWIPGIAEMPFDLSIQAGYTKLTMSYDMKNLMAPPSDGFVQDPNNPKQGITPLNGVIYDQGMEFKISAWNVNAIISKKLLFFTPYLGLGLNHSGTEFKLKGKYPIPSGIGSVYGTPSFGKPLVYEKENLIDVNPTTTYPRLTVGFKINFLAIFTFGADYTLAKYPMATIGFGLTVPQMFDK